MTTETRAAGDPTTRPPAGVERRGAVRHQCDLELTCYPVGGEPGARWKARVRDLSGTGIGLLLAHALERGTILILEMPRVLDGFPRLLGACVIHATPQREGGFVIGCALDHQLNAAEIRAWVPESGE
jgi:hypothetical protein